MFLELIAALTLSGLAFTGIVVWLELHAPDKTDVAARRDTFR